MANHRDSQVQVEGAEHWRIPRGSAGHRPGRCGQARAGVTARGLRQAPYPPEGLPGGRGPSLTPLTSWCLRMPDLASGDQRLCLGSFSRGLVRMTGRLGLCLQQRPSPTPPAQLSKFSRSFLSVQSTSLQRYLKGLFGDLREPGGSVRVQTGFFSSLLQFIHPLLKWDSLESFLHSFI